MTIELFMRKRAARHAGEVGLFCDAELFEDDWKTVPLDAEVRAELATERNMALLKFAWSLAGIIAENTEFYLDKQDAMDSVQPPGLKVLARHCKTVIDPETGECVIKPMSLKRLSNEAFLRLVRRMVWVTCNQILPGMEDGPLRAEIEDMIRDKRQPKEAT
jgi:hypothetical protein